MSFNLCNDDDAMDTSSPRRSTSGEDDTDTTFVDEYNAWRQTDRQSIKLRGVNFTCYQYEKPYFKKLVALFSKKNVLRRISRTKQDLYIFCFNKT